jgi:hypothetical protein
MSDTVLDEVDTSGELTEPRIEGQHDAHPGPLVRVCLVGAVLVALLAVAGASNPWQLVALQDHPLTLVLVLFTSTVLALVLAIRMLRRRWLRRSAKVLVWLVGVYAVIVVVAIITIPALTSFTFVQSEETIRVADDVSVHRTTWNIGALHSCVELHVRTGSGWSTRFGPTTNCAATGWSDDWVVSVVNGTVVVTRWNDTRCTYSIDVAGRRLRPVLTSGCEALGVID